MTEQAPKRPAAFAIPGDATQKTGGYIYEYELLQALRRNGRAVEHIELGAGFPNPSADETAAAIAAMAALPPDMPLSTVLSSAPSTPPDCEPSGRPSSP